jgi:hypothetical protein
MRNRAAESVAQMMLFSPLKCSRNASMLSIRSYQDGARRRGFFFSRAGLIYGADWLEVAVRLRVIIYVV